MSTILDAPETPVTPDASPTPPAPPDPSPSPAAAPVVADWRVGLPEELRNDPTVSRYKTVEEAAKGLREQAKIVGRKSLAPLTKDSTPEQVAEFRKAFGIPEKPDGYFDAGVKRPEVAASIKGWNDQTETSFLEGMHKLNASPEVVTFAMQFHGKLKAEETDAWNREKNAAASQLRQKWGPNYEAHVGQTNRLVTTIDEAIGARGQFRSLLATSEDGNDPLMIEALSWVASQMIETGAMQASGLPGSMSADEARAKHAANREEMKRLPEGSPRTRELVDEQVALTRIMNGRR